MAHEGLRYNKGKLRTDLIPVFAQQEYTRVLTKGAEKYADRNWEKGMAWSTVLQSLKRHLAAFEAGEDNDPESTCLHMAHVMTNAAFLTEYYKTYPQGDDRPHKYLRMPKIGLDIDEVCADWLGHWTAKHGIEGEVHSWNFDRDIVKKFEEMKDDKEFWLSIPPKVDPRKLPFEPHCYITARHIPVEWTMEWLDKHQFPATKVICIKPGESKVEAAKEAGIDWFVDDRFEYFAELNRAGICCFLMDMPHNRRYNVGYKRIFSLEDLLKYV